MLTLVPTSRFVSVDFPTFGLPTIATNPVRKFSKMVAATFTVSQQPIARRLAQHFVGYDPILLFEYLARQSCSRPQIPAREQLRGWQLIYIEEVLSLAPVANPASVS